MSGQTDTKHKPTFCESNKCSLLLLLLLAVSIATVVCVTFLDPNVRQKKEVERKWWERSVVYQIYPRSFQDSDGDGVGDLTGVIQRLDYLADLGIGAIWLSPFFTSPMKDFGYDVSNYTDVDPIFGNMSDFDELIRKAHEKGLKVIIDFVPNHTSNESEWFERSRQAKEGDKYRDFYIWNDGRTLSDGSRAPPNNWESVFEGSAWQWDELRQAYYYHAFLDSQPDLNYRNSAVRNKMKDVLRFWLNKGVDGLRVDAIPHLFEIEDTSIDERPGVTNDFDPSLHKHTKNQPEIFDVVKEWKNLLDEYDGNRFLLAETVGIPHTDRIHYYEAGAMPFYFNLIPVTKASCTTTLSDCYLTAIQAGLNTSGHWPNFVIGNHDNRRIADRLGVEYTDAMNMMLLTLPGTPTTYYGEELGMPGGDYTGLTPRDPYAITSNNWENSRDSERNPMQWNTSTNAGFTSGNQPWLPVNKNDFMTYNVEVETQNQHSSLNQYKQLIKLREKLLGRSLSALFSYQGILGYFIENYVIALNLDTLPRKLSVSDVSTGDVVFSTTGRSETVNIENLTLQPGEGIVILAHK